VLSPTFRRGMIKNSITIATPHRRDFSPEYVLSLAETLRDGRFNYDYLIREGSTLHHQRNIICREFLKGTGEYLLRLSKKVLPRSLFYRPYHL
jgi:hypothetical protein